jgi:hypothetical protein
MRSFESGFFHQYYFVGFVHILYSCDSISFIIENALNEYTSIYLSSLLFFFKFVFSGHIIIIHIFKVQCSAAIHVHIVY